MEASNDVEPELDNNVPQVMIPYRPNWVVDQQRVLQYEQRLDTQHRLFECKSTLQDETGLPLTAITISTPQTNICEVCEGLIIKTYPDCPVSDVTMHCSSMSHRQRLEMLFPFEEDNAGNRFDKLQNWRLSELRDMVPLKHVGAEYGLAEIQKAIHVRDKRRVRMQADVVFGAAVRINSIR